MENNEEFITGKATISINGEPVEMQLTVPASPVKPQKMLPLFQKMTNSFVQVGVEFVESQGEKISCKKGCSACCRQAVPIAEAEAFALAELVENMNEPKRSRIKKRFAQACERLHEMNWFERMENFAELTPKKREKLVMEHFYENIECPFLENDMCSIHEQRPLICREYLVTTPAENCDKPTAATIRPVKPLLKTSKAFRRMGISENLKNLDFVPLTGALEWAENHPDKFAEKTGQQWAADFLYEIQTVQKKDEEKTSKPMPSGV